MTDLADALLAALDEQALAELARRLEPYLTANTTPRLLTPAEAADILGIHPKTLSRATRDGRVIGAQRVGAQWRYRATDLELLPPTRTSAPTAAPRRRPRDTSRSSTAAIRGA